MVDKVIICPVGPAVAKESRNKPIDAFPCSARSVATPPPPPESRSDRLTESEQEMKCQCKIYSRDSLPEKEYKLWANLLQNLSMLFHVKIHRNCIYLRHHLATVSYWVTIRLCDRHMHVIWIRAIAGRSEMENHSNRSSHVCWQIAIAYDWLKMNSNLQGGENTWKS